MATRKSKGIYRKWKEEDVLRALAAVKDGVGVNEAARTYNVLKTTLKRHNTGKSISSLVSNGHPVDLPNKVEEDLVQHLLHLENILYGYEFKFQV
jgi:transposase-like protein